MLRSLQGVSVCAKATTTRAAPTPSAQRRAQSYPAAWQKPDHNIGTHYNRPITNVVPQAWSRAKREKPEPTGVRMSKASERMDLEFNFPDHPLVLEIHSVLHPTTMVVFRAPPQLSETEIEMYLSNVYGINNIREVNLQYRRGERWMDLFGRRWKHPDFCRAYVYLEQPVEVVLKASAE